MKSKLKLIYSFAGVLLLTWIFCFKMIPPGYVGVVVDLFGDKRGVDAQELHVGMHFIPPWKVVYTFPVFEQNDTWEGKNEFHFQTSEGMACSADIGITYHLRPDSIPVVFQKYRRGMNEITQIFIHNFIRDAINKAASKMKIEDLYGVGKEAFFEDVEHNVRDDLKGMGIEVSRIYLIGRFHFPQNVISALNAKIEANQRAQQRENELREAEAQAKKQIAEAQGQAQCVVLKAESEAKANMILSSSITTDLITWQAVQRWNGTLPTVVGGGTPLLQLPIK